VEERRKMGVGRATSQRRASLLCAVALSLVVVGAVLAGCSDDEEPAGGRGDGGGADEIEGVDRDAVDQVDTTEPKATDVATVHPAIEDLVERYDQALAALSADPEQARDADGEAVTGYLALFEDGNEVAATSVEAWVADADAGRHVEPADTAHPAIDTRLDGPLAAVSEEEVVFAVCQEQRYRVVAEDGTVADEEPHAVVRGDWTAVWDDGTWRLRRVEMTSGVGVCLTRSEG
jgi:predicted transcriptional regulator